MPMTIRELVDNARAIQSGTDAGPTKPTRVEVGQRWKRSDGDLVYVVVATCGGQCATSRPYGHGHHAHFDNGQDAPANWIMEACTYLGMAETGLADCVPGIPNPPKPPLGKPPAPVPPADARCRLGYACTHHHPRTPEPWRPSVDDWDLLPDA